MLRSVCRPITASYKAQRVSTVALHQTHSLSITRTLSSSVLRHSLLSLGLQPLGATASPPTAAVSCTVYHCINHRNRIRNSNSSAPIHMSTEPHMQQQNPMSQLSRLPIHSTATTTITTAVANEKIDPLVAPQAQATATEMDSEMEDGSGVECMDVVVDVEKESPVIEQFVNNIMKGGNRAVARRIISDAMLHIQTQTRQDPRAVIIAAVERASPFVKVASAKRRGKNIPTPVPLTDRQRYRTGILWIRDAALKGRNPLSAGERIGREVLAIMADKSIVLQKREQVHKLALANRSNIIMTSRKMR